MTPRTLAGLFVLDGIDQSQHPVSVRGGDDPVPLLGCQSFKRLGIAVANLASLRLDGDLGPPLLGPGGEYDVPLFVVDADDLETGHAAEVVEDLVNLLLAVDQHVVVGRFLDQIGGSKGGELHQLEQVLGLAFHDQESEDAQADEHHQKQNDEEFRA